MASVIAGKYRLVRKLAAGGMGEVFLAVQRGPQGIEKRVVLKRVLPDRESDSAAQMFLDEARVAADLHHPNVVDTYEVGVDDGVWFLAMEFLEGWDLRRIQTEATLTKRPIPLGPALHMITDVARGLHYAHEKRGADGKPLRIVHRDVSPQNILVTRDGIAKLLDFGIAKADIPRAEVTDPGMVRGKVAYMSPEQASASSIDRRSDLFSLGIVLYEITTLTRVYFGDDLRTLFNRVADAKIAPPSAVVPDYPKKLEEIVMTALRVRPSERFESGDAFATALEELLDDGGVPHSASKVARYLRTLFGDEDSLAKVRASSEAATVATPPAVADAPPPPIAEDETPPPDERAFLDALNQVLDAGDRARATNVTEPEDVLVGRDADIAAIERRFREGARLVTLHGTGGVGKTRLSLRLAGRLASGAFPGGAWFVDVSQARTPDVLAGDVGAVLGVPLTGADAVLQVGRALAGRGRLLLVLDGFEQLVPHADATVARWLRAAPQSSFLVTSREPLRIAEEQVHPVETLALPSAGAPPEESPAIQLFLHRARRARPGFAPRPQDWPLLEKIVSRLDGLPLALELAAARLSVLTPEKMLELFPKRLDLLSDTRSNRPTLRGVLDESWDLLRPWERLAFAQASVFRGGFDLAAAESVLDMSSEKDAPWTLDVLQSLCEKSLLRSSEPREMPGETRFTMYANVHDYAAEKLRAAGGEEAIASRHRAWYLRAGGEWAQGVDMHGGNERRRRLAIERENLEAVLERAVAAPRSVESASAALRAVVAMDPVASARGPLTAHLANLDAALASSDGIKVPGTVLALALLARGRTRRLRGRLPEALSDLGRALTEARAAGDRGLIAEILLQTGACEQARGAIDRARSLEEEALEIAAAAGDRRREALAVGFLALLRYGDDPGEQEKTGQRFRRALALHREIGNQRQEAAVLGNFGIYLRQQGRFEEALEVERDALQRYRELGERLYEGNKLGTLAGLHLDLLKYDEARSLYAQALDVTRSVGNRRSEGIFRGNAGILDHLLGRFDEAKEGYEDAIAILEETGDALFAALYSGYLAALLADTGHPVPAQRMLDAARAGIVKDALLARAVELHGMHLELARASRLKPEDARAVRETAVARLADFRSQRQQNEDVRLAARLLEQAVRRAQGT